MSDKHVLHQILNEVSDATVRQFEQSLREQSEGTPWTKDLLVGGLALLGAKCIERIEQLQGDEA